MPNHSQLGTYNRLLRWRGERATCYEVRLATQKADSAMRNEGFGSRIRTWVELRRLSFGEALAQVRIAWAAVLVVAQILNGTRWKRIAAALVQRGQRSCPYKDLRLRFGQLASLLIDEILVAYAPPPVRRPFDPGERVLVLKPYKSRNEPGVLYVKFSEVISTLPHAVDLDRLREFYSIVVEPSWTGLCDPGILQYRSDEKFTVVLAPDIADFKFIRHVGRGLHPIDLGPCDWVDPDVAAPFLGRPKEFDVVVNSNWAPLKRHHIFFRAMRRLPRTWRIALIGGAMGGGDSERVLRLARYYGVQKQIALYEHIPYTRVMEIVCASRCSALFSLKEGANRALAESMFCDVPVLLIDEHVGGIRKNVVPQTGLLVPQDRIAAGLCDLVSKAPSMSPRDWAVKNISCVASTDRLNSMLRELSHQKALTWTRDIASKANSPEMRYFLEKDRLSLEPETNAVRAFLRGETDAPIWKH